MKNKKKSLPCLHYDDYHAGHISSNHFRCENEFFSFLDSKSNSNVRYYISFDDNKHYQKKRIQQ